MFRVCGSVAPLLFLCAWTSPSLAQETLTTASVAGRVVDPAGAFIPHANVSAVERVTGRTSSTATDAVGRFLLPYLPVGTYDLRVQAAGFAEARRALQVSVGSAFDVVVSLPVTASVSVVDVGGEETLLEASRSQIAGTISEAEATQMPFNGRNYLDLALLVPGVSGTNTGSVQTFAETSPLVGQGYSINSQRNFSNGFVVDGLSANDDAAGLAGSSYSMDVVREFQVVTSGGQSEFGRALGGYVNVVTRSGTNTLHGTAYAFLRNQRFNAASPLSGSKLPLTQTQFGGSLGGPLRRDRTFVFANFEQRRLNTDGVITIALANAAAINAQLVAVNYKAPLLPVGAGPATLFATTVHSTNGFVRGDHQFSPRDHFNLRYSLYRLDSLNGRGVSGLATVSFGTAVRDVSHTLVFSNVATLSPRVYNETRGQFNYDLLSAPPNDELGPAVTISGVASFGRFSSSPTARLNYLYEGVDNFMVQAGAHVFKAGADFLHNRDTITFPQSLRGSYTFSSLPNFLQGLYNNQGFTQSFGTPVVAQNNPNVGVYLQDEWRASPRLTVNAGVRYDLEFLRTIASDTNNASPRLGIAWSPFADRRTVVRASYGLFFDRIPLRPLANALLSANNTTDVAQAALLSYTFTPGQPGAPVFPNVASAPPSTGLLNFTLMDRHLQNAYSQQASLELEQAISAASSLSVSYQHVRGEHLLASVNTNINPAGSRPNPAFGNSRVYSSVADSYYDGLAVSVRQKPKPWGSARLSYTWSKAIDDVGEFFFSSPVNNFYVGEDRGRSDDDQRHRLTFDALLKSPAGPGKRWSGRLTHGWQLSGILQYTSRLPFNVVTGGTTRQGSTQRPCAPGYALTGAAGTTLTPCSEALPGSLIQRNSGSGFDFFSLSARLSRTFLFTDRVQLQAIAESFNSLNHRNDMIPNATFGTGTYPGLPANGSFGQATAAGDPRNVQLALRLSF